MTKEEFESRTGEKVSEVDYTSIERIYMESIMDKDAFCEDWLAGRRKIMEDLAVRLGQLRDELRQLRDELARLEAVEEELQEQRLLTDQSERCRCQVAKRARIFAELAMELAEPGVSDILRQVTDELFLGEDGYDWGIVVHES